MGEPAVFTVTQLMAMYLVKLRDITSLELRVPASDVVIAVPGWYTEIQRRALLDAAAIAGLNPLRIINESTATALGYGITKTDLPAESEPPRVVVFIDIGHSNMSVSVVAFNKGQFRVKATAHDRHLGGRDIDYALVQFFAARFKEKYRIDVLSNPKATFRLTAACERLKKVLSANAEAPLNVENIMNDVDASSSLGRDEYETLIASVLDRITDPIHVALMEAGISAAQVDAVELTGGSTRVPAVKARIQSAFPDKQLRFTLNQDEAVVRGATFACAMLSPVFRVKEFTIHDINPYPVKVQWSRSDADPDDDTELLVFPQGNVVPSAKVLTFHRTGPFELEAVYAEPGLLPGAFSPFIGRFTATKVEAKDQSVAVKVKARLNIHGVVEFAGAHTEEAVEKEEESMEVDGSPADPPKKKRVIKKKDVVFTTGTAGLSAAALESFREIEAKYHAADKLVIDTEVCQSTLLVSLFSLF